MKRRNLLGWSAAVAIAGPRVVQAQPAPRRVGVLAPGTAAREAVTLKPFFEQMERLGWVEGKQVVYDRAFADDRMEDLPQRATQLVARRPELIYAPPQQAAVAAHRATTTIPIVFASSTDPVGAGLVASLSRPGGNATGLGQFESLAPKLLQLLRELVPRVQRVGLVGATGDPRFALDRDALQQMLGANLVAISARNPTELDTALQRLLKSDVQAIFTGTALVTNRRERVIELTSPQRIPVIGHRSELAEAGALFTYGLSQSEQIRASALIVDKVLRGANPAELPVQQPTGVELVINLRTAGLLGIEVPSSVLLRAERVIR